MDWLRHTQNSEACPIIPHDDRTPSLSSPTSAMEGGGPRRWSGRGFLLSIPRLFASSTAWLLHTRSTPLLIPSVGSISLFLLLLLFSPWNTMKTKTNQRLPFYSYFTFPNCRATKITFSKINKKSKEKRNEINSKSHNIHWRAVYIQRLCAIVIVCC